MVEVKEPGRPQKKKKKSFWFEYAKDKGVDPHKSAWRDFSEDEKEIPSKMIRFCRKCGASIHSEGKFCERCGQRIQSR